MLIKKFPEIFSISNVKLKECNVMFSESPLHDEYIGEFILVQQIKVLNLLRYFCIGLCRQ